MKDGKVNMNSFDYYNLQDIQDREKKEKIEEDTKELCGICETKQWLGTCSKSHGWHCLPCCNEYHRPIWTRGA